MSKYKKELAQEGAIITNLFGQLAVLYVYFDKAKSLRFYGSYD